MPRFYSGITEMDIIENEQASKRSLFELEREPSPVGVPPGYAGREEELIKHLEEQSNFDMSVSLDLHPPHRKNPDALSSLLLFDQLQPKGLSGRFPSHESDDPDNHYSLNDTGIYNKYFSTGTSSAAQTLHSLSSSQVQDPYSTPSQLYTSSRPELSAPQVATITPMSDQCRTYMNQVYAKELPAEQIQLRSGTVDESRLECFKHQFSGSEDCHSISFERGNQYHRNQNECQSGATYSNFSSFTKPYSQITGTCSSTNLLSFRDLLNYPEVHTSRDYRNDVERIFQSQQGDLPTANILSSYFSQDPVHVRQNNEFGTQSPFEAQRKLRSCGSIATPQTQFHHDEIYKRALYATTNPLDERSIAELPSSNTFPFGAALSTSCESNFLPGPSPGLVFWSNPTNAQTFPTFSCPKSPQKLQKKPTPPAEDSIIQAFLDTKSTTEIRPSDPKPSFDVDLDDLDPDPEASGERPISPAQEPRLVKTFLDTTHRHLVTDFTYVVMTQLEIVTFDTRDRRGNRGKTKGGFPGLACLYCKGATGRTGRYFPTTIRTLADSKKTLFAVNRHLADCRKCPANLKKELHTLFCSHLQEKKEKRKRHGSQRAFFRRIWEVMHRDEDDSSPKQSSSSMSAKT